MIRSVIDEIIYKMNSHRYERLKLTDLAISSLQNINCNGLNAIYEDPYSQYKDVVLLEYVKIPEMQDSIKYITMKLDENERANTIRLMKVKDMVLKDAIEERRARDAEATGN